MNGTLQFSIHWTTSFRYDLWSYSYRYWCGWLCFVLFKLLTRQTDLQPNVWWTRTDWWVFGPPSQRSICPKCFCLSWGPAVGFCALLWTFILFTYIWDYTCQWFKLWCILCSTFKIINNNNNKHILHLHLSDAFIQSDLQCIQAIHLYCQYVCSLGIEPTTFALLTQCSNHWATGTHINYIMILIW